MAEFNQLEGILEVPIEGGSVKLHRRITYRVKAATEDWLELRARKRVFRQRKKLNPEEYRESMDAVARISAVQTKWGGPVWQEALKTLPGIVHFLALLVGSARSVGSEEILEADQADLNQIYTAMQNKNDNAALMSAYNQIIGENKANFLQPPDEAET
jgi:hypothetical protein